MDISAKDDTANYGDAPVPEHAEKTAEDVWLPRDCSEIDQSQSGKSGLYEVQPAGGNPSFQVYCDMDTDGGNWTVFQRRIDGTQNFNRSWIDYKTGFGDLTSEYWLGNDKIYQMTSQTSQRNYELRIDLTDEEGNTKFAKYESFRIDNETMKYRLHIGSYSGNAGNSLLTHNGMVFSTWDNDNDMLVWHHCAGMFHSGWWFKSCHQANLNGLYNSQGIIWYKLTGYLTPLKASEMKMRPTSLERK
ncbi:fibrinogen-like protein A [Diadema setosum]|uniref:fibrinogen-like protein A n=1 Tax=Diadema setosum TaxID=31175 RepID=UPI003B3B62CC